MRCVTLNTWKNEGDYHARVAAMAAGLGGLHADVIALQECFVAEGLGLDTAAALGRALSMHVTQWPMRAKKRPHDGASVDSRADLAILSRARPMAVAMTRFVIDPRDGERGLLSIELDHHGIKLRVGCTHLTHLRDETAATLRADQAMTAAARLMAGWSGPAVLMGDMNADARHSSMAPLFANPALDQTCRVAAKACGDIDHVLLFQGTPSCAWIARSVAMPPNRRHPALGPSDHPAVIADIAVTMSTHASLCDPNG